MDKRIPEVQKLAAEISLLLTGNTPEIQGAVLAELLSIWLAGYHVPGDEDATRKMRADLLAMHCYAVRQLVPINAKLMGTTP